MRKFKDVAEITELSVLLKKLMIDFYFDKSDFETEMNFLEQLDIGRRGIIGAEELKAFSEQHDIKLGEVGQSNIF